MLAVVVLAYKLARDDVVNMLDELDKALRIAGLKFRNKYLFDVGKLVDPVCDRIFKEPREPEVK